MFITGKFTLQRYKEIWGIHTFFSAIRTRTYLERQKNEQILDTTLHVHIDDVTSCMFANVLKDE